MSQSVVWITGASSGIGEAIAKKFASKGYRLILSARREVELLRVKSLCTNADQVQILPLDLASQKDFDQKVKEAISFFGQVDLVIHNGGISQRALIKETDLKVDRKVMEVNYFGTVALTKAILPHFLQKKSGQFVVITSLVGIIESPFRSSYVASKHALHGFFDTLRAEHYLDNIAVTIVCPGFINTKASVNALTGDGTPLGILDDALAKGLSPEDFADKFLGPVKRKKQEVYIGGKEVLGVYIKRFFPRIFSKIIQTAKVR